MHGRDLASPALREFEGGPGNPPGTRRRDLAHRKRQIRGRHELSRPQVHVAVGIKALGILPHDHEVHRRASVMRKPRTRSTGPDIGIKIEGDSQLGRNIDAALRARRIVGMRDGPEQDAVRGTAALEHRRRKGGSARLETDEPDLVGLELQAEPQAAVHEIEDLHRRGGNFRTDAVAREDYDAHGDPLAWRPRPLRPRSHPLQDGACAAMLQRE